jgi:hypothetical protein
MAENYRFFDGTSYTEAQFAEFQRMIMRQDGYIDDSGSELEVIQHTPADMIVIMGTGCAWIQGTFYQNTAAMDLAIDAADPANPRIDRVILRLTWASNKIEAVVLKGTAAASPTAPALTQTASVYELSLAQIAVGAGETAIHTADITDERRTSYCGIASNRMGRFTIDVDGSMNANTSKITGLMTPTVASDAATKGYVDSYGIISSGMIVLWSGSIATIPSGFVLCNGSSSTPDLRGKFVIGAQADSGATYDVGDTGGATTATLTTNELPAHTHNVSAGGVNVGGSYTARGDGGINVASSSAGSGASFSILNPYYALAYIMKT